MKYIVSWSGGKDCSLALYKAQLSYGMPVLLLTSVPENPNLTMAHGYRETILRTQAAAMNIPIAFMTFGPGEYRSTYVNTLQKIKQEHQITHVVYGDLYLEEHRTWIEAVCQEVGLTPLFPAWIRPDQSHDLFEEYLSLGFKAIIVNVNKRFLGKEWIGKELDVALGDFAKGKFCPMAECGEYHSLVVDGPLFSAPVCIEKHTIVEEEDCYKMQIEKISFHDK